MKASKKKRKGIIVDTQNKELLIHGKLQLII